MKLNLSDKWKPHFVWLIILLIFCGIIYGKQKSLNDFKAQIQKYNLENLAFEEELNEKGQKIVTQEQIILSQKDAIEQGLLEINRLKKVKSQVNVVTQTIVDTFVVSHTDTIVQYFEGGAFLKLPQSYTYLTNDISFGAEVTEKGLKVNNISIENSASITIGYKGNGLFRKKTPVVELVNSNPFVQTNSVSNIVIEEKPNPLTDHKVWGGVGFLIGLFIQ